MLTYNLDKNENLAKVKIHKKEKNLATLLGNGKREIAKKKVRPRSLTLRSQNQRKSSLDNVSLNKENIARTIQQIEDFTTNDHDIPFSFSFRMENEPEDFDDKSSPQNPLSLRMPSSELLPMAQSLDNLIGREI